VVKDPLVLIKPINEKFISAANILTFRLEYNLDLPNRSFIYRVVFKRSKTEIYRDCNYLADEGTIYFARFVLS
jgi:hypothetical protein